MICLYDDMFLSAILNCLFYSFEFNSATFYCFSIVYFTLALLIGKLKRQFGTWLLFVQIKTCASLSSLTYLFFVDLKSATYL